MTRTTLPELPLDWGVKPFCGELDAKDFFFLRPYPWQAPMNQFYPSGVSAHLLTPSREKFNFAWSASRRATVSLSLGILFLGIVANVVTIKIVQSGKFYGDHCGDENIL